MVMVQESYLAVAVRMDNERYALNILRDYGVPA